MNAWVVHCRKQPYDIYVGRFSRWIHHTVPGSDGRWGNPWNVEKDENGKEIRGSREEVVFRHREWLLSDREISYNGYQKHGFEFSNKELIFQLPELKDKVLSCWCRPDHICHADLLAELANG